MAARRRHSVALILAMAAMCWAFLRPLRADPPAGAASRGVERAKPTIEHPRGPKRLALCIGIDNYHCQGYQALRFAQADAKELGRTLADLKYEVTVMSDDAANVELRPEYERLDHRIFQFLASANNPDDTVIISFSGHGNSIDGDPVLIPLDYAPGGQAIDLDRLVKYLTHCPARKKLLIVDACRSAASDGKRMLESLTRLENCMVISGCGKNEFSMEDEQLGHGRLTQVLLDGLHGQAYAKDQEFLLADQLSAYIKKTFQEKHWTEGLGAQSPEIVDHTTAKVRFDLARRDLPKPTPLSNYDRKMLARSLEDALDAWRGKNYTDAVDAATHALRIDEKNADALAERALAYLSLGYQDKAMNDVEAALEANAGQLLAVQVQGEVLNNKFTDPAARQRGLALLKSVTAAVDAEPARYSALANGELACRRLFLITCNSFDADPKLEETVRMCTRIVETKDAPPPYVASALFSRCFAYERRGELEKAVADATRIIEIKDAGADPAIMALLYRAEIYGKMGAVEKELADYDRVIAIPHVRVDQVAEALLYRGIAFHKSNQPEKAVAEYTRLVNLKDAPHELVASAICYRGESYGKMGQGEKEIADYDRVLQMKDARPWIASEALLFRAFKYHEAGDSEKALADCNRIIEMKAVPADVSSALMLRASVNREAGDSDKALADYTRVIEMKDASPADVGSALLSRAFKYQWAGEAEKELADYNRVIEMKGALAIDVADALANRGFAYNRMGQPEKEIVDDTRVIEMKDLPPICVATTLVYRSIAYGQLGQAQKQDADYRRAIAIKNVKIGDVSLELTNRGWINYELGRLDAALVDTRMALQLDPQDAVAGYNVGAILLRQKKFAEARKAYDAALAISPTVRDSELADLVELRDKLNGPPETRVFLGWLQLHAGQNQGRKEIEAFLKGHPQSPLEGWARELLATPPHP